MNKHIFLVISICLIACAYGFGGDFRNNNWGDSKSDVRKVEKSPFHHERSNELAYFNSEIPGIIGGVIYYFKDDRLDGGKFVSRNSNRTPEETYRDYLKLQTYFDLKSGFHQKEDWQWNNEIYKGMPEKTGEAIAKGHLKIISHWQYANTEVKLVIEKRRENISVRAFFTITENEAE